MERALVFMVLLSHFSSCDFPAQRSTTNQGLPPKVTAVFPSSDSLPENLLRMCLHFSKPMKTIGNLENIKLVDAKGQEIVGAIFNNVHELWDKEQKQLTLIFDPSRVKTGLSANKQMGRALQVGQFYTLRIGKLDDVDGNPLADIYTKSFFVTKEDKVAPNTKNWSVNLPKANSKTPLTIQFPDMLDHLSLLQRLQLTDTNNQPIEGQIEIKNQETTWQFTPTKEWSMGDYILYVHTRLEDPAGNNLNGLFDHQIGTLKYQREGQAEQIKLKIEEE